MSTNTAGAYSSTDAVAQTDEELVTISKAEYEQLKADDEHVTISKAEYEQLKEEREAREELKEKREQLKDRIEEQGEILDELEDRIGEGHKEREGRIDEMEERIKDLAEERGVQIEELTERYDYRFDVLNDAIENLEAEFSDDESGGQDGETTLHRRETPIERLLDDPMGSGIQITASVQRAMRVVGNYDSWSKKVQAGHVINENLKMLLEAAGGERLYWKQVHRAGEKVEELTNGAIEFVKTAKNGWVFKVDPDNEDFLTRVVSERGGG